MTPPPSPLPAPDARQRLLEAAVEVFGAHGFEGASVRDITDRAGVNLAAPNYYFGGKEGLYIEAVKYAHSCSTSGEMQREFPPGMHPADKLNLFVRGMVAGMFAPASPAAMKLVMREMADPGKAAHVVVQEFIRPMAHRLKAILHELLPDLPEPQLLMTGFSVIGQILYYRQNRPVSEMIFGKEHVDQLTAEMVADHVVAFTFRALGVRRKGVTS
jgi:TetR/AcrR family transcriptional regulator, regulator of cefoperazone and chloramphenicol sensitivity